MGHFVTFPSIYGSRKISFANFLIGLGVPNNKKAKESFLDINRYIRQWRHRNSSFIKKIKFTNEHKKISEKNIPYFELQKIDSRDINLLMPHLQKVLPLLSPKQKGIIYEKIILFGLNSLLNVDLFEEDEEDDNDDDVVAIKKTLEHDRKKIMNFKKEKSFKSKYKISSSPSSPSSLIMHQRVFDILKELINNTIQMFYLISTHKESFSILKKGLLKAKDDIFSFLVEKKKERNPYYPAAMGGEGRVFYLSNK